MIVQMPAHVPDIKDFNACILGVSRRYIPHLNLCIFINFGILRWLTALLDFMHVEQLPSVNEHDVTCVLIW